MQWMDWLLIVIPLGVVLGVGWYSLRYVKGVVDFISGRRAAGRYLLCLAGGELQAGAVVFISQFEVISHAGFTLNWWVPVTAPILLLFGIAGFVMYRFRETRALTLAQFFELRYSKRFRIFTGMLAFFAGICNFGIIPVVGARALVYFLSLPPELPVAGGYVPTHLALMAVFLAVSVFVATSGGAVTLMVVNCIEGIISNLFYLVIIAALLYLFSWSEISATLANQPPGESMLNPFDSLKTKDFNIWMVAMSLFGAIYGTMAWQNSNFTNSSAYSPHESRMAGVIANWRGLGKGAVITLLAICAYTFMAHPDFAQQAQPVHDALNQIGDEKVRGQVSAPIALTHLLPMGIRGLLCVVLLMGIFGGDATHLHSWSGIFVQDVLVALRKKPFGAKQHLRILRWTIVGVAVFAFLFGSLMKQTEYIIMWWTVTMAIFIGGAGAAIIGGLYWKKGTTPAAWASMLTGSTLSVGGIIWKQIDGSFPLNGIQISFFAILIAVTVYVTVSLLTCRQNFNMDRMLHRGAYAVAKPSAADAEPAPKRRAWLVKLLGIDENFTLSDKWIAGILFGWSMLWSLVSILGTVWNLLDPWSLRTWSIFWNVTAIGLPSFLGLVTCVWFTWGGLKDIKLLFKRLNNSAANPLDDGTVVNNQNLDEYMAAQPEK